MRIASLFWPHIKCQQICVSSTLVIEFVFHHRFTVILVMKIMPKLKDCLLWGGGKPIPVERRLQEERLCEVVKAIPMDAYGLSHS